MRNTIQMQEILAQAQGIHDYVIKMRREFHQYPEVGFAEIRTSRIIADELQNMGLDVQTGIAKTGVVGVLKVDGAAKTVAFRADMDALPITEENDVPYKSQNAGVFHACGHDANMAMLLGSARLMVQRKDQLKRQVKFIFQPSEEQPPGGAKLMIEQRVLDGVDEIYGIHIDPNLASGIFGLKSGKTMAATDRIALTIMGIGGHASMPHLCADPIVIAAEVILAIQTIVSRRIDPLAPCIISLCQITGGTTFNVIPDKVKMSGTVRTFEEELRQKLPSLLEETIKGITASNNTTYQFEYINGYPALNNPQLQVDFIRKKITELFGERCIAEIIPKMGGEDFAYYLKRVNGSFIFLGTGNQLKATNQPLHSPKFLVDEDMLYMGPALFAYIACSP